jgi:arsenate reductase
MPAGRIRKRLTGEEHQGPIQMARRKTPKKLKIIFVDEVNDMQSQIAEYFLREEYGDMYEAFSAGPKKDYINCELISVMYQAGYDMRRQRSKDFDFPGLPKKPDYIVFLEESTYDLLKDVMPWDAKQILKAFRREDSYKGATDDLELAQMITSFVESVRVWVSETFSDPDKLEELAR